MGSWNYYPGSTPRPAAGGIKARSRRGSIGEAWWSQRFIKALERMGNASRLQRGKRYARQGQVIGIWITGGAVQAEVQGSSVRPYRVAIRLRPLTDAAWEEVFDRMSAQAIYAAQLLAGEVPHEIEKVFDEARTPLFPTSEKDIETDCTCPDWENPCKHIAAVYYLLAEQFDEDPFLLFTLRGRSREEVVAALRERRTETADPAAENTVPPADRFWKGGDAFCGLAIAITGEAGSEGWVLKMLGEAPFSVRGRDLTEVLAPAYPAAQEYARKIAGIPDPGEEPAPDARPKPKPRAKK